MKCILIINGEMSINVLNASFKILNFSIIKVVPLPEVYSRQIDGLSYDFLTGDNKVVL